MTPWHEGNICGAPEIDCMINRVFRLIHHCRRVSMLREMIRR